MSSNQECTSYISRIDEQSMDHGSVTNVIRLDNWISTFIVKLMHKVNSRNRTGGHKTVVMQISSRKLFSVLMENILLCVARKIAVLFHYHL